VKGTGGLVYFFVFFLQLKKMNSWVFYKTDAVLQEKHPFFIQCAVGSFFELAVGDLVRF